MKMPLEKCLDNYFLSPQIIDGYKCESCGKSSSSIKKVFLQSTPDNLIVSLKRFNFTEYGIKKNPMQVEFPKLLDVRPYVNPKANPVALENTTYHLVSVINHFGESASSGHYTADSCGKNDELWVSISDENVKKFIDFNFSAAYILFYKKISNH